MADPIDIDAIRTNAANAQLADDADAAPTHGAVPTVDPLDVIALCDEVDRLRTCVSDLRATDSRRHFTQTPAWPYQEHRCQGCLYPWPCSDERARRALEADR